MAKPRMDLSAFVGKLLEEQHGDVLREGIRVLSQASMETAVAGLIGAERHEGERTAYRNGARLRTWDTRMGTIELAIPRSGPGRISPRCFRRDWYRGLVPDGWRRPQNQTKDGHRKGRPHPLQLHRSKPISPSEPAA